MGTFIEPALTPSVSGIFSHDCIIRPLHYSSIALSPHSPFDPPDSALLFSASPRSVGGGLTLVRGPMFSPMRRRVMAR